MALNNYCRIVLKAEQTLEKMKNARVYIVVMIAEEEDAVLNASLSGV